MATDQPATTAAIDMTVPPLTVGDLADLRADAEFALNNKKKVKLHAADALAVLDNLDAARAEGERLRAFALEWRPQHDGGCQPFVDQGLCCHCRADRDMADFDRGLEAALDAPRAENPVVDWSLVHSDGTAGGGC